VIIPRTTVVRLLTAPIAFLALEQLARADMVYVVDGFANIGIYYGTAELFSPGGTLLSTTYAMTVETTVGCQQLGVVDGNACAAAMGNAIVSGLATQTSPAPPPVFSEYFESQLSSFEDNNGLGNAVSDSFDSGFDPSTTPTATSQALYTDLTSQPGGFAVTGDTGFVPYGAQFDYVFAFGPLTFPVPYVTNNNPPCCATSMVATMNVQFFERDLQLTEVAAPEPRGTWLALVAVLLVWLARRKLRQPASARKTIFRSALLSILCLAVLSQTAHADPAFDTNGLQLDIFVGTSVLTTPGGPFTSTYMEVGMAGNLFAPSDLSVIVPSFASQIAADPTIQDFVRTHIESFVSSNLGYESTDPDPSGAPEASLYTLLTTQPVPFVITSDSGYTDYGAPFAFQYLASNVTGNCTPTISGSCQYIVNVSIFDRSIAETEIVGAPEPSTTIPSGLGWLGILIAVRRARMR
jgi:hypothetical protein